MIPTPAIIALQIAFWTMWLEVWGVDPVPLLRACADVLEEK